MARFALLTAAAFLLLLPACGSKQPAASPDEAGARRDVDVHELKEALDAGSLVLLDVRSRSEYFAAHVPAAELLPIAELQAGRTPDLAGHEGEEVWIICQSGARSSKAADLLVSQGHRVVNVTGGTAAWINAGYPVD